MSQDLCQLDDGDHLAKNVMQDHHKSLWKCSKIKLAKFYSIVVQYTGFKVT